MPHVRQRTPLLVTIAVLFTVLAAPAPASGADLDVADGGSPLNKVEAYLDGKPIKLADVADWYCEDFAFPIIDCFSDPRSLETRANSFLAAATGDYVLIYDYTSFAGSYMYVSQDYSVLALIGWSDRISSMKSINSGSGHFYVDWFYGGNAYYFCCNTQYASLGAYDNTFSSVHRL
jgi:hypothetical protein